VWAGCFVAGTRVGRPGGRRTRDCRLHAITNRHFGIDAVAKKRRVATTKPNHEESPPPLDPRLIASGFLGGAIVYLSYHPSDSVSVEAGDALWLGMLSLVILAFTLFARRQNGGEKGVSHQLSSILDVVVWALAIWIMLAAFATSSHGNLRMATNEAWLWITGAAIFTSVRRIAVNAQARRSIALLMMVCASGLAIHALHQAFVTLPINRIEFEQDPERVLMEAGYDAPLGSSERAVFAGRLYDGGPTATFALANSMAAVLVGGILIASGLLRFSWRQFSPVQLVAMILVVLICAAAILASRSRSALLATVLGMGLIYINGLDRNVLRIKRSILIGGIATAVGGIVGGLVWIGKGQPVGSVPAWLEFRIQYWRSTLRMVVDRPLFGAGPGNFQSVYERYREASTAEQIADPHNLLFETLGSGGFIGLGLLISCFIVGAMLLALSSETRITASKTTHTDHGKSIWIGAAISLSLVWLFALATRQLPDIGASLFVLPMVAALGVALAPSITKIESQNLDRVIGVVLLMVLLHLMVSGGWTVPGVAVVVWVSAGIVTRIETNENLRSRVKPAWLAGALCLCFLGLLWLMSVRPVDAAKQQMAIASHAVESGQYRKALRRMEIAAKSDPWSPEPMIGLSDLYRWQLIGEDVPAIRTRWNSSMAEAKRRGGDDPSLLRIIGVQQLHLFQRYGKPEDLAAALDTFTTAVEWSPVNQWMIAQLASVVAASGDLGKSRELMTRAERLSGLGVNVERIFSFQLIYPAQHYGVRVKRGAIRRPADQVLSELKQAFYRKNAGVISNF